jgi:hypothetical protein
MPRRMPRDWPPWWYWRLELSDHVIKRMAERRLIETDVREMLEDARGLHRLTLPGRWGVYARFRRRLWMVILEPEFDLRVTTVVTVFELE